MSALAIMRSLRSTQNTLEPFIALILVDESMAYSGVANAAGRKEQDMRFLLRVSFPVEAGNASARKDGFKAIQTILEAQKPEAAYFLTQDGKRTGLLIINLERASQMAEIAEPWFLALNAEAWWSPIMVPSDLQAAGPAIANAIEDYS